MDESQAEVAFDARNSERALALLRMHGVNPVPPPREFGAQFRYWSTMLGEANQTIRTAGANQYLLSSGLVHRRAALLALGEQALALDAAIPSPASRKSQIQRIPGSRLLVLAELLVSRRTYENVFEPTIADLWEEYTVAVSEGRTWKSRFIRIRGYMAFFSAAWALCVSSVVRLCWRVWSSLP